jgi:hypothetical protein
MSEGEVEKAIQLPNSSRPSPLPQRSAGSVVPKISWDKAHGFYNPYNMSRPASILTWPRGNGMNRSSLETHRPTLSLSGPSKLAHQPAVNTTDTLPVDASGPMEVVSGPVVAFCPAAHSGSEETMLSFIKGLSQDQEYLQLLALMSTVRQFLFM